MSYNHNFTGYRFRYYTLSVITFKFSTYAPQFEKYLTILSSAFPQCFLFYFSVSRAVKETTKTIILYPNRNKCDFNIPRHQNVVWHTETKIKLERRHKYRCIFFERDFYLQCSLFSYPYYSIIILYPQLSSIPESSKILINIFIVSQIPGFSRLSIDVSFRCCSNVPTKN